MKDLQIWDNGGKTLDRYTIFKAYQRAEKSIFSGHGRVFECVSASHSGGAVYTHCHAVKGPHLGKRNWFGQLDIELQRRLREEFN